MADVKKIATRESYGNALTELGKEMPELVVLDADLAGATKTGIFKKAFPDRHIDCGIAECDMVGVAAGLSTMGFVPFASSFAMFAAGRAFEQIRNTVGYPHLNVKIGATHGGISVGEDGASHQCNEDFAVMRTIPGMVVMCPSDDVEAKAAVRAAAKYVGPVYMRFSRFASPVFHSEDYQFENLTFVDGDDLFCLAHGRFFQPTLLFQDVVCGLLQLFQLRGQRHHNQRRAEEASAVVLDIDHRADTALNMAAMRTEICQINIPAPVIPIASKHVLRLLKNRCMERGGISLPTQLSPKGRNLNGMLFPYLSSTPLGKGRRSGPPGIHSGVWLLPDPWAMASRKAWP